MGVYFTKISMVVKLTCNMPDAPPARIDLDLEGIPVSSLYAETNLPEYIKERLYYEESANSTDPLLEDRVLVSQLISDISILKND
jgi:hypothetical protein